MSHFAIEGGKTLRGEISVNGSKNAALPLLAASILTDEAVTLHNVPPLADVTRMIDILRSLGCDANMSDHTVSIHAKQVDPNAIAEDTVGRLRGSILFLGALLGRCKSVTLARPGGDIIGARPIDVHLDGFRQLGAQVSDDGKFVSIDGSSMQPEEIILKEFSVTATENMLLAAACMSGRTTIRTAAAEPHVVALCSLLEQMGVRIEGAGTHDITIEGTGNLQGTVFTNIPDMLEAGLFILLGAATRSAIAVRSVPTRDLRLFFKKIKDIGIEYKTEEHDPVSGVASILIRPGSMKSFNIQALPHPGIATDLLAPFSVIATQVEGSSLIHDPMYEGRFKYIHELQKMGAHVVMCDPHRVIITGPTTLRGQRIPSLDIRAGATLIMAGLVATGQTIIDNAEIIDRGYANLEQRLQALGAQITRKEDGADS